MRARSLTIVELLLRNPKHSQLLYKPNRAGETPYNIDMASDKSILGQVFGTRKLNTNEDTENMLGYDLYSCSLADLLTGGYTSLYRIIYRVDPKKCLKVRQKLGTRKIKKKIKI